MKKRDMSHQRGWRNPQDQVESANEDGGEGRRHGRQNGSEAEVPEGKGRFAGPDVSGTETREETDLTGILIIGRSDVAAS